jgi:RND superfamily putative drug exporter
MQGKRNLAHRMGRWSGMHPWLAITGWIAFVAISFVIGGSMTANTLGDADTGVGESGRAMKVIDKAFTDADQPAEEALLIQSRSGKLSDAALAPVVADATKRLAASGVVAEIQDVELARNGRAARLPFTVKGDPAKATDKVAPIEAATKAVAAAHPSLLIEGFGDATSGKAFDDKLASDFKKAEVLSIPITLIILIVAFGALLAAGIPVLLGLTSVFAAFGLTTVSSQIVPTGESTQILMMLIGMAVGVDYSLFYLKREREERARGAGKLAALEAAAATSGHAVLVSGLTVMASLAGMFLMGDAEGGGMAVGSILVVGVAVLGSLTVLPAILTKLGDRVHKSRIPVLRRMRREERDSRVWGFVLGHVLRRPAVALVGGIAVLAALAIPAIGMHTKVTGMEDIPRDAFPVMRTLDHLQAAFPGQRPGAELVIQAENVNAPEVQSAIKAFEAKALESGQATRPFETMISRDNTVLQLSVPIVGDGTDDTSQKAVQRLRDDVIGGTLGSVAGVKVDVGGAAAETADSNSNLSAHAPLVFGFVLTMAFLLLLVTFRSIVIPIKAIILNLFSVAAAFGVLTLVFQHGLGEVVGLPHTTGIVSWLPVFLFVILFGLSMDYHVFIISRIKEGWDNGLGNEKAVEEGIRSSAGVVTAAATVMVAVFSIFATLSLVDLQEFGVGLAFAVLIDATLIRGVVLPASMKLLGKWNWYMPSVLGWLPKVGEGRHTGLEAAPA